MTGGIFTDFGYVGTDNYNEWYVNYNLPENTSRILEGDDVTFFREFDGITKMKRAIGRSEVYIPRLKVLYHE